MSTLKNATEGKFIAGKFSSFSISRQLEKLCVFIFIFSIALLSFSYIITRPYIEKNPVYLTQLIDKVESISGYHQIHYTTNALVSNNPSRTTANAFFPSKVFSDVMATPFELFNQPVQKNE